MSNDKFNFQQFTINQRRSAMKVGTDGVLLGAWANVQNAVKNPRILDIGTGTGLIALMLAQRFPDAYIDAIEIDHEAAEEAKENVANSPWKDRINVIECSLEEYGNMIDCSLKEYGKNLSATDNSSSIIHNPSSLITSSLITTSPYHLIVSNPPFYNATLKPDDDARAAARHYDSLPFSEISDFAQKYLSEDGILAVIYPTNCEENIMLGIANSSLKIHTICDVCTKVGKQCKRRLASFSRVSYNINKETLNIMDADGQYSKQYRDLTSEFYLQLNT